MPRKSLKRSYRPTRRRRGVKRRRTSYQNKKIARISKAVTLRATETKRFAILNENFTFLPTSGFNYAAWAYRNIFGPVPQGVTAFSRNGSEIHSPMLALNINVLVNWKDVANYNTNETFFPIRVTVMIVSANEQIATGSTPTYYDYTSSSSSGWFYMPDNLNPRLNGNNIRVLKKWTRLINPRPYALVANSGPATLQYAFGGTQSYCGKLRYKWRRKITYEDTGIPSNIGGVVSGGTTRGNNYYILAGYSSSVNRGIAAVPPYPLCRIFMDSYLYYKDP